MRPAWITAFLEWTESRDANLVLTFLAITLPLAALIYFLGWRFRRKAIRTTALFLIAFPILILGFSLSRSLYHSDASGFSGTASHRNKRDSPATTTLTIPIANPGLTQTLDLSPFAANDQIAEIPITIHATLASPRERTILDEIITFAPTTTRLWTPIRRTFATTEDGDHTLTLVIPAGVDAVNVEVEEVKKK